MQIADPKKFGVFTSSPHKTDHTSHVATTFHLKARNFSRMKETGCFSQAKNTFKQHQQSQTGIRVEITNRSSRCSKKGPYSSRKRSLEAAVFYTLSRECACVCSPREGRQ